MVDFGQALRDYVSFGYCTSLNNIATFGEIFGGGGSGIGEFGINAARFLHNAVCNTPPPPLPDPPFTGGQCAALYNVEAVMTRAGGTIQNPFNTSSQAYGPIQGARFRNSSGNTTTLEIVGAPFGSNTTGIYPAGGVATNFGSPDTDVTSYTITSVSRADGQPDTCGSPPPVVPPYVPGSNSITNNVSYTDNSGNTISIPTTVTFGYATVNVNGELNIPFTLNLDVNPTANISGNLNLNTGDINFNAGNPALQPSSCGGNSDDVVPDNDNLPPDSPVSPNVPDPTPDPTKPQSRKLLIGALVTVSTPSPQASVIYQSGNPDVYAPDLGLVSFQVSAGGYTGWTEDIRVKNARQFIPCPWKYGAIDVKGTPRPGSEMTVSPLYEKFTEGKTFPD